MFKKTRALLIPGLLAAAMAGTTIAQDGERERGPRDGDRGAERGPRDGDRGPGGPRDGDRGPGGPRDGDRGPGGPRGFGGPGGPGGGPEMMMRMMPVLAALDADHDGKISKSEIDNAAVALRTLDKNSDGQLTAEELRPEFPGRGPGGPEGRGPGGPEGRGPEGRGPGGPEGRGPGGRGPGGPEGRGPGGEASVEGAVQRMLQMDKNNDGSLTADELPERMAAMIDRADSDGDGKLSKAELTKMAEARMARGGEGDRPQFRGRGGDREGQPGGERPRRPESE
ncbi:EF-hand domain-containing protein [Stieleria varia]|uniref:EF hand n=1 Tax=Stieleria varia TaxID=2528005 RepID=A0A5C6B0S5_9BACT|nr:EF-hand domain-containing protein [Stieleria varia]TWU05510.1 EF hand [Stieleria varia]